MGTNLIFIGPTCKICNKKEILDKDMHSHCPAHMDVIQCKICDENIFHYECFYDWISNPDNNISFKNPFKYSYCACVIPPEKYVAISICVFTPNHLKLS